MARVDDLRAEVEPYGFTLDTYSPGDGVTRYRFFRSDDDGATDYFAGNGIYTALGWAEARTFARGLVHGATLEVA